MYIIVSPIQIKPEHKDQYVKKLVDIARESVSTEPGCLRLDVIQDADDSNRVWVYEIFKDTDALQTHMKLPFFVEFMEATKDWREESGLVGAGRGAFNIWPPDDELK
jgi:quinol monooxygenase YgiN